MASHFDAIELITRYETPLIKDMEPTDDVLEWVAAYVGSDAFQDKITDYCAGNADKFTILLTKGGPSAADLDAVEGTWKQLHEEFIDTANGYIEAFLVEHGFTMAQYEKRCDEEMALSEERQRHTRLSFFVQIIMACCEYEQFLNLMRRVADPEYSDKKELQYEAESILCEANSADEAAAGEQDAALRAKKAASAQEFLDFFQANPEVSLDELTLEFQKRMEIS